jgi:hypothetical protein
MRAAAAEVDISRSAREAQEDWRASTLDLMATCLLQSARVGVGRRHHRLRAPQA